MKKSNFELAKKNISIIGTVGIPAKYGGFETLAEYLTKYLRKDYDFTVYCSAKSYEEKTETYNGARLDYLDLDANGIQSIRYDIVSMLRARKESDTLLILGVSGCTFLPVLKYFTKAKLIVNIDGLEWKRDKWSKIGKWFLKLSEKFAVNNADVVITDNVVIQQYVKQAYHKESVLIAYGADHVEKLPLTDELTQEFPVLDGDFAMTVCRIEPENNIHMLLEAFSGSDNLPLVIIGNWTNSEYGRELRSRYSSYAHIHLLDPIYEQKTLNQIRSNCKVYVHGHSAGGTNPSLVEAMYMGLPVFAFDINYNRATTEDQAYYFQDAHDLTELLKGISSHKINLQGCAKSMKKIAEKRYTWEVVADQYGKVFAI